MYVYMFVVIYIYIYKYLAGAIDTNITQVAVQIQRVCCERALLDTPSSDPFRHQSMVAHRTAILPILRVAAMDMVAALLAAASARRAESGLLVSAVVLHHTGLGIYMYIYTYIYYRFIYI